MKLQQLRYVLEIVRHGNHLSAAAEALHASQPGVSRQIQLLEAELGFEIFLRTRNRIIGLTDPGKYVLEIAQRVVTDMDAMRSLKEDITTVDRGRLIVATTHTVARYLLPKVVGKFVKQYPDVQLVLKQGDPETICEMVTAGDADLAIGTETVNTYPNLVSLPCLKMPRSVVAKAGHPILKTKRLTLQAIADHPIITYEARFSGRRKVMNAFAQAGITPNVVLSAIDADVCKTYVEMGLGIAILADLAFDARHDVGLRTRDAHHLFESSTLSVALRANTYLRKFTADFIRLIAPTLRFEDIDAQLKAQPVQKVG